MEYQNINKQEKYWDSEVSNFDAIYSHKKSKFSNYLDKKLRWDMYRRFDYTMENSEPIEGKTFLDIGCGTGRFSLEFARRKAKEVVGIDISANMIDVCNKRAKDENLGNICSFIKTDPFEYKTDKMFNVSIGIGLFDYIIDCIPVIKRMRELSNEKIILTFPKKWSLRAFIRYVRLNLRGCDVYFFTLKKIDNIMKEAGLTKYRVEKFGQLYGVTAYIQK
jgi:ubiquinone/menaquinone biosynthesis C-methylase UbiE